MSGVFKLTDSANIFLEDYEVTTAANGALIVTASATNTFNGTDFTNLNQTGARFFITITSVAASMTLRVNIQIKDPIALNYFTIASVSMDAIASASAGQQQVVLIYPGVSAGTNGAETIFNETLSRVMRIQASLTATVTASAAGSVANSFSVSISKLV